MNVEKTKRKTFTGVVVSDKMDKTITVLVSTRKMHSLYKKYIIRSKKYKVHDEKNEAQEGDTVRFFEGRPVSKDKRWWYLDLVRRGK